jgi:hypothetical protein
MYAKKHVTLKTETAAKQSDKGSRPPIYDPKIHPQATKVLCNKGATIAELAAAFDVAISTICILKVNHPVFFESCRVGIDAATDRVERSMFERTVGYAYESVKISCGPVPISPCAAPQHVAPDPRAGEFWLTNRSIAGSISSSGVRRGH